MKKQLNIAIIGFGGMGEWHCHQMKASKIMNVVGVYDISEKRQKRAAELGLKVFESPSRSPWKRGWTPSSLPRPTICTFPIRSISPRGESILFAKSPPRLRRGISK